jgi:hypothetical protein
MAAQAGGIIARMSEGGKKKVGIFTTFYRWDSSYSLTSVVNDQLVMHVEHGYEPVLFVLETFPEEQAIYLEQMGVEVRRVIPQIILEPYKGFEFPENWRDDVAKVADAVKEYASDIEIMITHDIVFIDTYLPYNVALREANLPCKYLHWIHSAPSPRPLLEGNPHASRYLMPANSKLVYLNNDKALALAEMYGTYLRDVRVVYNSRDPRTFWDLHPLVHHLINKYDLLSADVISVYPVSATRMIDGKQIDVVIGIHEQLRRLGLKTRLIVCNAHANGREEYLQSQARATSDVIFTSLEDENGPSPSANPADWYPHKHGVPSKVVSDLFRLSNVFIFPTISENCSLILLEAMLAGNLLILNKDCTGLEEHAGAGNAIFLKFGKQDMGVRTVEHAVKEDSYLRDIAKIITSELETSKPLRAKQRALQTYNYDAIFNKIESLYYEA